MARKAAKRAIVLKYGRERGGGGSSLTALEEEVENL